MKIILKYFIFYFGLVVAQEPRSRYVNKTADISSINDLAYRPPITLDPKIRKALLNVLNRLEEQDNKRASADTKFTKTKERSNNYYFTSSTSTASPSPSRVGDIKWEYKAHDPNTLFKKYGGYFNINVATSRSVSNELKDSKNVNGDGENEHGALFFQIPEKSSNEASTVHSELNVPSTASPKNALPGGDILFANLQNEINEQYSTASPPTTVSNTTEDAKKSEDGEDNVEFFEAPLLTAFTLEQDERGLPHRIIPLAVAQAETQAISRNRINQDTWENRYVRDQQRDVAVVGGVEPRQFRKPDLQAQENVVPLSSFLRQELESHYQQLQERKRHIEFEKERLAAEQEKARRLKLALEWQQNQREYARALNQNEIVKSEVSFQKSVEPQVRGVLVPVPTAVPTRPLQTFDLGVFPWPQPVQHFQVAPAILPPPAQQFVNLPRIVDRQLRNLFEQSGLNPQGRQEDLNIVSKVLALNHEPNETIRWAPKRSESARNVSTLLEVSSERTLASVAERPSASISPPNVNFDSNRQGFLS